MIGFFRGFKEGFREFGLRVNDGVTVIVMLFVYVIGIGLTSIFGKLSKKKFLDLNPEKSSYWINIEASKKTIEDYRRSF